MKKTEWFDVKTNPPEPHLSVLVSDGYGEFVVASIGDNKQWYANSDLLEAYNGEGSAWIDIKTEDITSWSFIVAEDCPLPDWKD